MLKDERDSNTNDDSLRPCPHCRGAISALANTCKFCGKSVPKILKTKTELVIKEDECAEKEYLSSSHFVEALGSFDIDDANVEKKSNIVRGNIVVRSPSSKKSFIPAIKMPQLTIRFPSFLLNPLKWVLVLALFVLIVPPTVWLGYKFYDNSDTYQRDLSSNDSSVIISKGSRLDDWKCLEGISLMKNWHVKNGIISGVAPMKKGSHIYTKDKWRDFEIEMEYKVESNSNGGVYLKGLVEIQVASPLEFRDSPKAQDGAIFGQRGPQIFAANPVGEWNHFKAIWKGNTLTVYLNDYLIHNQIEITKPTRGRIPGNLTGDGPIMLQVLKGKVWYRNIKLRPAP